MIYRLFLSPTLARLRSRGFLHSRGKLMPRVFLFLFFLAVSLVYLLLGFPAMVYAQPDSTQEVYEYVMQWGTSGSDTGQFNGAGGLCIDDSGYIYVCDRWNNRIQKFGLNGLFILMWGRPGTGQGEFNEPYDITADHSGYIYVNDNGNRRIQKFDSRGNFILMWPDTAAGLDCGPSNSLYICDGGSSPYESLKVYDTLGNHLRSFGNPDTTEWWLPQGVAVDDSEFIYVSKYGGNLNYIVKFDSNGNLLLRWGSKGTGEGQFGMLYELGSGEKYRIFAPDAPDAGANNHRVQKFKSEGQFVTTWGSQGGGNGQFQVPFDVIVDSLSFVYVSDPALNRIQKFRKTIVGVGSPEKIRQDYRPSTLTCFPNPVKNMAQFRFTSSFKEPRLSLYNYLGQKVRQFIVDSKSGAEGSVTWNGKNEEGHLVPTGVYFASIENIEKRETIRITVIH